MNFGLHISCMVEDKLALIQRPGDWTQADEAQAYERCLKEALEENGRAWADGNIRVGDYILLSKSTCAAAGLMIGPRSVITCRVTALSVLFQEC